MKIIRQTVSASIRKLSSNWTMEQPQSLRFRISDEVANILQEEIDAEILAKLYQTDGWYLVPCNLVWNQDKVRPWLQTQYPTGGWHLFSGGSLFREKEIAMEFELKWT